MTCTNKKNRCCALIYKRNNIQKFDYLFYILEIVVRCVFKLIIRISPRLELLNTK